MIEELAEWLPTRSSTAPTQPARRTLSVPTSSLECAAMSSICPLLARAGQRGRPRKKGSYCPASPEIAALVSAEEWSPAVIDMRGEQVSRLLFALPVIWYAVCPDRPLLLVIVATLSVGSTTTSSSAPIWTCQRSG